MIEKYSNKGKLVLDLKKINLNNKKNQNNNTNNAVFKTNNNNVNIPDRQDLIIFVTMIPAKENKTITTQSGKQLNTTLLDYNKKITVKISLEEIFSIIYHIQNDMPTLLTLYRDPIEKSISITVKNGIVYINNKSIDFSVGIEKTLLLKYFEKCIDYILNFRIQQSLNDNNIKFG